VLLRLAYLAVTNAFAVLRLLPVGDRDKDAEILALRHQITVLERQLGAGRVKFAPEDRAFLTALLAPLPRQVLRRLRLLVRPDTVLGWHRDLMNQRHARTCRPKRPGRRPPSAPYAPSCCAWSGENPSWGYRRVHGELATLGIKVAPSTVWEIYKVEGIDPAPARRHDLGRLPAIPGRNAARLRLHRDRHPGRAAPVHPRGHRARQPACPHPRHHRASVRGWVRRPSRTS
jgi:putative transposase